MKDTLAAAAEEIAMSLTHSDRQRDAVIIRALVKRLQAAERALDEAEDWDPEMRALVTAWRTIRSATAWDSYGNPVGDKK